MVYINKRYTIFYKGLEHTEMQQEVELCLITHLPSSIIEWTNCKLKDWTVQPYFTTVTVTISSDGQSSNEEFGKETQ